jgi:hypothetical protein
MRNGDAAERKMLRLAEDIARAGERLRRRREVARGRGGTGGLRVSWWEDGHEAQVVPGCPLRDPDFHPLRNPRRSWNRKPQES